MDECRHLTTDEVARELRASASTVRYWRHIGYGPQGFKVGKRVLYPRVEVDRWLSQQRTGVAS